MSPALQVLPPSAIDVQCKVKLCSHGTTAARTVLNSDRQPVIIPTNTGKSWIPPRTRLLVSHRIAFKQKVELYILIGDKQVFDFLVFVNFCYGAV